MENKTFLIAGLIIAILIGVVAVFFASGNPDGLESTALMVQGQKSLTGDTPPDAEIQEDTNGKFTYEPPMPDYSMGEALGQQGSVIAIVIGTLVTFGIALGASKVIAEKNKAKNMKSN